MKILFNPENGAPIQDIWLNQVQYFVEKQNQVFKPGDIVKVDESVAEFILETYGFVKEISKEKAKEILEFQKNAIFKCDSEGCKRAFETAEQLRGHNMSHAKAAKLDDELGIPVIGGVAAQTAAEKGEFDSQKEIDQQASAAGLIGEGLTVDK